MVDESLAVLQAVLMRVILLLLLFAGPPCARGETYLVPQAPKDAPATAVDGVWAVLAQDTQKWRARVLNEPLNNPARLAKKYRADGVVWVETRDGHGRLRFYRAADQRVMALELGVLSAPVQDLREATRLQLTWLLEAPVGAGLAWRPALKALPPVPTLPTGRLHEWVLAPPRPRPHREPPVVPQTPPALAAPEPVGTQVDVRIIPTTDPN